MSPIFGKVKLSFGNSNAKIVLQKTDSTRNKVKQKARTPREVFKYTKPPIRLCCNHPVRRCGGSLTSFMTGMSGVWWLRTECVGKLVPLPESRSFLYTPSILTLAATAKVPKAGLTCVVAYTLTGGRQLPWWSQRYLSKVSKVPKYLQHAYIFTPPFWIFCKICLGKSIGPGGPKSFPRYLHH